MNEEIKEEEKSEFVWAVKTADAILILAFFLLCIYIVQAGGLNDTKYVVVETCNKMEQDRFLIANQIDYDNYNEGIKQNCKDLKDGACE
jgi:hypothetical protein